MKNTHVLPTDKSSRLVKIKDNLFYTTTENIPNGIYKNIYITSDKEIKEGDWYLYGDEILKSDKLGTFDVTMVDICKKIILTTDQELINDGVQSIDDEFLEWFCKNPSCEKVEIENIPDFIYESTHSCYKTIIPKEERKIDTCYNFDKEIGCVQNHCRCEKGEPKQDCFSLPDCACKTPDFDVMKGLCKVCGNSIIHLGKRVSTNNNNNKQKTLANPIIIVRNDDYEEFIHLSNGMYRTKWGILNNSISKIPLESFNKSKFTFYYE